MFSWCLQSGEGQSSFSELPLPEGQGTEGRHLSNNLRVYDQEQGKDGYHHLVVIVAFT